MSALGIHHVGIAVRDLDEARERYERLFGATLEASERVEDQGVDALSMLLGESGRVELLAPLADDTPVGRFLARRGEGMHHLAFGVADLRAELAHLRAAGATKVDVAVGGVEAEMAVLGALTTPGTDKPLVVLDLGGGSTDAAVIETNDHTDATHLAGAGDLVTKLIDAELGLDNLELAEEIKRCPLGKAESFFHIRLENGTVQFFEKPLPPTAFARVVALGETGMNPIPTRHSLDRIRAVRRTAKERVFVVNALRALRSIAPGGDLRQIGFVVLLGGCALDFEIPELIADAVAPFGIVCGTGNVRGTEGPRNAVASGLVASYAASHAAAHLQVGVRA